MPASLPNHGSSMATAGVALVTDADGSISGEGATGLYWRDRRILGGLHLRVNGRSATMLGRVRTGPGEDRLIYGHWGADPDHPEVVIERTRHLDGGYRENLTLRAFRDPVDLRLVITLVPDGATVGHLSEPHDSTETRALVESCLTTSGLAVDGMSLSASVHLDPRARTELGWSLGLDISHPRSFETTSLTMSDRSLQEMVDQASWDLEALTIVEPATGSSVIAAGAPHFLAVFGRDALLASLLSMVCGTDRALDTLDVLAFHQGSRTNERTLEQPGRILHELRIGDMGVFGVEPGTPYYGSVDATPLFVVVLAECLRWGADPARIVALLPAARAAVDWCRHHGDSRGFVHSVPHHDGIINQGWKDSADSIVRPDGTVVHGPTSLVEVQGYVHAALCGLADLESHLGNAADADGLRAEAEALQAGFHEHFLVDAPTLVAPALDAHGEAIPVRASNVGHLLTTELIDDDLAAALANRLLSDDEFSGWGLRTLSRGEAAYNPLGYHDGTVWPHDTALFLRGLNQRGFEAELATVSQSLIELATALDGQLPELLGGFATETFPRPVPYPASARPQGWAAAVPFQVVTALLGLRPAMQDNEIRLRPRLGERDRVVIEDLRLGERTLRIDAVGRAVHVTGDTGDLNIVTDD